MVTNNSVAYKWKIDYLFHLCVHHEVLSLFLVPDLRRIFSVGHFLTCVNRRRA